MKQNKCLRKLFITVKSSLKSDRDYHFLTDGLRSTVQFCRWFMRSSESRSYYRNVTMALSSVRSVVMNDLYSEADGDITSRYECWHV